MAKDDGDEARLLQEQRSQERSRRMSSVSPVRVAGGRRRAGAGAGRSCSLLLLTLPLLVLLLLALAHQSSLAGIVPREMVQAAVRHARGGSSGACRMSFMSPSYRRVRSFELAVDDRLKDGPWGLYLYREVGYDNLGDVHHQLGASEERLAAGVASHRETALANDSLAVENSDDSYAEEAKAGSVESLRETARELGATGVPVLFIPGNAGSFRQVRSLASSSARLYRERATLARGDNNDDSGATTSTTNTTQARDEVASHSQGGAAPLDWFALDFNDDLSAFHGQTLLDQAAYAAQAIDHILDGLYAAGGAGATPRTSITLVAHSMGAIVAREALAILARKHGARATGRVATLISIAGPHGCPPVTVDSTVDQVYERINERWRAHYFPFAAAAAASRDLSSSSSVGKRTTEAPELKELVTISLAGGETDGMISSECASLASLAPRTRARTIYSSAVPGVRSSADHLALTWCNQIVRAISGALLDMVKANTVQGVIPSPSVRLAILERALTGALDRKDAALKLDDKHSRRFAQLAAGSPGPATISRTGSLSLQGPLSAGVDVHEIPLGEARLAAVLRNETDNTHERLTLLTSSRVCHGASRSCTLELYACGRAKAKLEVASSGSNAQRMRAEEEARRAQRACIPLAPMLVDALPASKHDAPSSKRPTPTADDNNEALSILDVELSRTLGKDLADAEALVVVRKAPRSSRAQKADDFLLAELAPPRPTHVVQASLFRLLWKAYEVSVRTPQGLVVEIALPQLRSSAVVLRARVQGSPCIHSEARFAPLLRHFSEAGIVESQAFPNAREGLLRTFSAGPYTPRPRTDEGFSYEASGTQLQLFLDGLTCGASGDSLAKVYISVDVWASLGTLLLRYRMAAVSIPFALVMIVYSWQLAVYDSGSSFAGFGATAMHLLRRGLAPLCVLLYLAAAFQQHMSSGGWLVDDALAGFSQPKYIISLLVIAGVGILTIQYAILYCIVAVLSRLVPPAPLSLKPESTSIVTRAVSIGAIFVMVLFVTPYQFVYLVLVVVHLFTTSRALATTRSRGDGPAHETARDAYNHHMTLLCALATLAPVTALTLIVWVRNVASSWFEPFVADHDVLRIAGFMLIVESSYARSDVPRARTRLLAVATTSGMLIAATEALIYGTRYTYRVYFWTNLLFAALALSRGVGSEGLATCSARRAAVTKLRRSDDLADSAAP